jgi:hypothetical protein
MKLPPIVLKVGEVAPGVTEHPVVVITLGFVGLEILHDPSSGEKPVPVSVTSPPTSWPRVVNVIDGLVTVKDVDAESPVLPVTIIE